MKLRCLTGGTNALQHKEKKNHEAIYISSFSSSLYKIYLEVRLFLAYIAHISYL